MLDPKSIAVAGLIAALGGCSADRPLPDSLGDAGAARADGGASADAGAVAAKLDVRVSALPTRIDDHPFPSRHWLRDGRIRLPVAEDTSGFEWVTAALINERQDGFALRPRARVCFLNELPDTLPTADRFTFIDGEGLAHPVGQLTAERMTGCVTFAPLAPLPAAETSFLGLRDGDGAWGINPPDPAVMNAAERAVVAAHDLVFASAFVVQSLGRWFDGPRAALEDSSAYGVAGPGITEVARVDRDDLVPGLFGALTYGRTGYVLSLHRHSFILAGSGTLSVNLPAGTGAVNRRFNTVGVTLSLRDGDGGRSSAVMGEDGSIVGAVSGQAGDTVDVHQDLFFGIGPYPSGDAQAEVHTAGMLFGRFAAPRWRDADGVLAEHPVRVDSLPFHLWLPRETPAAGAPLVIFGHGYTGMAYDGSAYAETFAASGAITVAINADGHGGGSQAALRTTFDSGDAFAVRGRGRDMDGDGTVSLAEGWVASWQRPRFAGMGGGSDGNRQTVLDIVALVDQLLAADLDGVRIDPARIYYVGHSNGGRYGMALAALESRIQRAALLAPPGQGYLPVANSFRTGTAWLLGVWEPALTNDPHSIYGLFDEGISYPGEAPVWLPLGAERVARLLARQTWNAGDSNGEGAAHLWRSVKASGADRADLLIQIYPGDVAVPQNDTMRLVDALGGGPTVSLVQPWDVPWNMAFAGYELLYRHLLPQLDGTPAFAPAAKARLAREQVRRFLLEDGAELDVDGAADEVVVNPDLDPLRGGLGFDFADLRRLQGY